MTFREKLQKLITMRGYTQTTLGEAIPNPHSKSGHLSQTAVYKILSGETTDSKFIPKICKVLECSVEWLLEEKGEAPKGWNDFTSIPNGMVPVIGWNEVTMWLDPEYKMHERTYEKYVNSPDKENHRLFALPIKSDSMVAIPKSFDPGTIIIINPDIEPRNSDYVLVLKKGASEPIFRQFIEEGGKTILKPLNRSFDKEDYAKGDDVFCGVLVKREEEFTR